MALDPSIPLSYRATPMPTARDVLSLQELATQSQIGQETLQAKVRENQQQNALLQILKAPGATDQSGRLTPQTLAGVAQVDPVKAAQLYQHQQQLTLQDMAYMDKKKAIAMNVDETYVNAFDEARIRGLSRDDALQEALRVRNDLVDRQEKDGTFSAARFSKAEIENGKADIKDPDITRAMLIAMGGTVKNQAAVSPIGKLEADYRLGRISKEDYEAQKKKLQEGNERPYYQFLTDPQGNVIKANARTGELTVSPVATIKGPTPQRKVEEAKQTGEALGKYTGTVQEDAAKSAVSNRYLDNMEVAAKDFTPGKLAPLQSNLIQWAQATGVSVSDEDKKAAGSIQALTSMAIKMAGTATRQADAQPSQLQYFKILESMPNEARTPDGFQKIVAYLRDANNYNIYKHEQLSKWRSEHDGSAEGFEAQWPAMAKSLPLVWNQKKSTQKAPKAALDYLRAHPETAEQFKAKYGYTP